MNISFSSDSSTFSDSTNATSTMGDNVTPGTALDNTSVGSAGAAVTNSIASAPGSSTAAISPTVPLVCSASFGISADSLSVNYSFREHPRVVQALQLFASVELVEVHAFVYQTYVYPPDKVGTVVNHYAFGIAPRATASSVTSSTATTGSAAESTTVVSFIPHLVSYLTGVTMATSANYSWSASNFPPGIQLDYRATETRFNYAQFLLTSTTPQKKTKDGSTTPVVAVKLNFTVNCAGLGFGNLY
jgi:hypothetical protein